MDISTNDSPDMRKLKSGVSESVEVVHESCVTTKIISIGINLIVNKKENACCQAFSYLK